MVLASIILALPVLVATPVEPSIVDLVSSVAACGVKATNIVERWNEAQQETFISVRQESLSNATIKCLARTSWKLLVDFQFVSPGLQAQYDEARAAVPDVKATVERMRRDNRRWLARQGLLSGALRIRAERGSLSEQARRIEVFCGFAPESVLQVSAGKIWIRPTPGTNLTYAQFQKLNAVMEVVVLEHAVAIVGQEAR